MKSEEKILDMLEMEIFRDIQGYDGLYQVSNFGNVKSFKRDEKILKCRKDKRGYIGISLCKNGVLKSYRVHRLVAQAFIPNIDNKPQVNHKDENKANNNVSNLEWCTSEYNNNYGSRSKRATSKTKRNKRSNTSRDKSNCCSQAKKVICITTNEIFNGIHEASRKYKIDRAGIIRCCQGKSKSAGKLNGLKLCWSYYKEID